MVLLSMASLEEPSEACLSVTGSIALNRGFCQVCVFDNQK